MIGTKNVNAGPRPAPRGSRSLVGRAERRAATQIREIQSSRKAVNKKIIVPLGCYLLHGAIVIKICCCNKNFQPKKNNHNNLADLEHLKIQKRNIISN